MHASSPGDANLLYLLIIPLLIWVRLRRAKSAARASDLWFEREGDHYIYHPFGHYGAAYLVPPAVRDRIRARQARLGIVIAVLFVAMASAFILLRSLRPDLLLRWLPLILELRLAAILTLVFGGLALRYAIVRPLYRHAPLAPRRISRAAIGARSAALSSWVALCISSLVLGFFTAAAAFAAIFLHNWIYGIYAALMGTLLALNLRRVVLKWRHRTVAPQAG